MSEFGLEVEGFAAAIEEVEDLIDDLDSDREFLVGTGVSYSVYLEFGTSKMDPKPFFQPALNEVRLEGVRDFVHLSVPSRVAVDVRWELDLRSATNTETSTQAVEVAPPVEVAETVFRCVNDLLADVGIGLEAEVDDDDEWEV